MSQPVDIDALLTGFRSTAYRIEALARYAEAPEEAERIRAGAAGEPLPPRTDTTWLTLLDNARAAGKTIERVRVVTQPLSEYERFELRALAENAEHGERIRVVTVAEGRRPEPDVWIFDEQAAVALHYSSDGDFTHADYVPVDRHLDRYWSLTRRAVPLTRYEIPRC